MAQHSVTWQQLCGVSSRPPRTPPPFQTTTFSTKLFVSSSSHLHHQQKDMPPPKRTNFPQINVSTDVAVLGSAAGPSPAPGCSGAVPLPALSLSISAQHRGNFIPWQTSKARHVNQARCEQSGLSGVTCSRQGRAGICLAEGTPRLGTLQSMQEQSKDMQIFLLHSLQNTAPCSDS